MLQNQLNTSIQSKVTLESLVDDPIPFRAHFKLQNQLTSSLLNETIDFSACNLLDHPSEFDLLQLGLPELNNSQVLSVNHRLHSDSTKTLSFGTRANDDLENIYSHLSVQDLRLLCLSEAGTLTSNTAKTYIKIKNAQLLASQRTDIYLFSSDHLSLDPNTWSQFTQQLIAEVRENLPLIPRIVFACDEKRVLASLQGAQMYFVTLEEVEMPTEWTQRIKEV